MADLRRASIGRWDGDTLVFVLSASNNDVIVDRTSIVLSDASRDDEDAQVDAETIEAQMMIEDRRRSRALGHEALQKQPAAWAWDCACAENNRNPITESGKTLTLRPDGKPLDRRSLGDRDEEP